MTDAPLTAPPPPVLKLVPPVVPKLDDAVAQPALPAIAVPAPAGRLRYAEGEPDRLTKLRETAAALQQPVRFDDRKDEAGEYVNPDAYHTPGRGRAFLVGALSHLGEAMQHAQQQANAQGRRVEWGDVATGAAEALGSGVGSAVNPKSIVYAQRDREAGEIQRQYGEEFQRRGQAAQLNEMEMKPVLAAAKINQERSAAVAAQTEKQIDNLRDTWKHLPEYQRGDPRFAALDAEAQRLGVSLPDFKKDAPPRNPVTREVDGKAYQYDDETKAWVPAQGLPAERRIEVPGYGALPPSVVYSADATREAGNVTAGTQAGVRQTEAQNQNAQNAYRAQLAERDEALKAAQSFNALHGELDDAIERYKVLEKSVAGAQPSTPQDKAAVAKAQAEMDALAARIPKLKAQAAEQLNSVDSRYGKHLVYGSDERFRVNPAPPPPAVIAPPPAQMRQGPRAVSVTAATPESDVRAEARRLGKDEEAAVAKWRSLKR